MAQGITTGLLKTIPYLPAILPDANYLQSLVDKSGPTTLLELANIGSSGRLTRLRRFQTAYPWVPGQPRGASGLQLIFTADGYTTPPVDALALLAHDPTTGAWGHPSDLVAASHQKVTINNQTGGLLLNQWASWGLEVWDPTLAQLQQIARPLTPQQQRLADQYASGSRGVLPRSIDWVIANEYVTQIIDAVPFGRVLNLTPSAPGLFIQEAPRGEEILVLAALAVSGGNGSDGLSLQIGIDSDEDFYDIQAFGLGNGKPQPAFIQATQQLKIQATVINALTAVMVSGVIWHVRKTDEIRARTGGTAAAATVEKEQVGVL